MIKNIMMSGCATYDNIGTDFSECKKINFVYGANGSGKSTIANYLDDQRNVKYSQCNIEWTDTVQSDILVYNRNFRKRNFQSENIPGVFTLGEATIEDINELEAKDNMINKKQETLDTLCDELEKKEEEKKQCVTKFKDDIWTRILKKYENNFKEAFTGLRNSKDNFYTELLKRIDSIEPNHYDHQITLDELNEQAETLFAEDLHSYLTFNYDIRKEIITLTQVQDNDLLQKSIVGNNDIELSKIINRLGNFDWVNQGRNYVVSNSDVCPFCQNHTINDNFRHQLENLFDEEYNSMINDIEALIKKYSTNIDSVISQFDTITDDTDIVKYGGFDINMFSTNMLMLKQINFRNNDILNNKRKEPGRKFTLEDVMPLIHSIEGEIIDANIIIKRHNSLVDDASNKIKLLTDEIWDYCLGEQKELINNYRKEMQSIKKAISSISNKKEMLGSEIGNLNKEIIERRRNVTSVQPTVDEINRLLNAYGFTNFHIAPAATKKNSYQIQRDDGSLVEDTLSEGEETFIAFLYFMQLTKGSISMSQVSTNKIIVLDDPISSLDSTVLYIVSTIVKDLTEKVIRNTGDVEQVFVFTHNVFFHKEASFINGRTKKLKDVNYWIIRKDKGISAIYSYGMDNPISTSYELLWHELRDDKKQSLVTLQNTMRRIIENYFGMLGSSKDLHIEEKFKTAEDRMICKSLLCWINDGSHSIPDDLFIDSYTDLAGKYRDVFKSIFVNTGNEAHYKMMMDADY